MKETSELKETIESLQKEKQQKSELIILVYNQTWPSRTHSHLGPSNANRSLLLGSVIMHV